MAVREDIGPTVLVTGGSGFFGRVLTRKLLDQGLSVRVLDVAKHPLLDARAELVQADLRDDRAVGRAVEGATTVFHTAALINLCGIASSATRKFVHEVNVGGTQALLDAALKHGTKHFVYTSTNNVVFDREIVDGDETEQYATRHFDLYTETKILAEQRVLAVGKEGKVKTCALRPGGIWGPGEGGVMLDKVLDQVAKGALVARVGPRGRADNTHVDNLAHAELLAARALHDKPELVSGHAYFITDGEPMDPMEWFRPLFEELGVAMPTRAMPKWFMYALGYVSEWLARFGGPKPLVTRIEVLKVTREHSFRLDKAREHLGYEPLIKSDEGLRACAPWAREYIAKRRGEAPTPVNAQG
jgi:3beta-hydroxy-delta5-steroid dehydrogenase/steroid delta-isomerase